MDKDPVDGLGEEFEEDMTHGDPNVLVQPSMMTGHQAPKLKAAARLVAVHGELLPHERE